jgi:hypothetical protein
MAETGAKLGKEDGNAAPETSKKVINRAVKKDKRPLSSILVLLPFPTKSAEAVN